MPYPSGQIRNSHGVYEWDVTSETELRVAGNGLVINNVIYNGSATCKLDGNWDCLWGDVFLYRPGDSTEPTPAAKNAFKGMAVRIANDVWDEDVAHQTAVAVLEEEQRELSARVISLKEEIEECEDRLQEIEEELHKLL